MQVWLFTIAFSKFLGQCVHEGVSWRRPLLCTCSPYILWSSLRGKKGKFWKFEKSFGSEHVSPLFFLLLAPLPSPTATAPHYALQNRRIYFCILFKNIKILRPIVFIFGIFSLLKIWGKKGENSKSSRQASAQSMSVILFFLLFAGFISSFVFRHFWRRSYQNQLSFSGKDSTADFFVFRHLQKRKMGWNAHLSPLPSPTATATSLYFVLYFVQKYLEIFPWVFILPFFSD